MSQDVHFIRGQATFSRIVLEHLAETIGFEVPHVKETYNLNEEALLTSLPDFKKAWKNGEYFDAKATSTDVTHWQENAIQSSGRQ